MATQRTWKDYELEIEQLLREMYPEAEIRHDVTIVGQYSKSARQIDILVTDYAAGNKFTIIIDGKYYGKRVDVKGVESFISMMEDVKADKGLMISQKGYTKAAISRAYHDPARVELDILNFDELKDFQAAAGLPYSGHHGMLVPAPFGWVIDIETTDSWLATFFQRGLTQQQAEKNAEWMYVNIRDKGEQFKTMEDLMKYQDAGIKSRFPNATIGYHSTIKRPDERTAIRIMEEATYPALEITGFIDFKDFVGFFVLFSPKELQEKNIRKLEYMLAKTKEVRVDKEGNLRSKLAMFKAHFTELTDDGDRSMNLKRQADFHILLGEIDLAMAAIDESLKILPANYQTIRMRADLMVKLDKPEHEIFLAFDALFSLGPANPTVWNDMVTIVVEHLKLHVLIAYMKEKILEVTEREALGNLYYYLGVITEDRSESVVYLNKAHALLKPMLPRTHLIFKMIRNNLKILDSSGKGRKK